MEAHDQNVVEPINEPSLGRMYRDLKEWYPELFIEKTPYGLCQVMWFCKWQSLHPASNPAYQEMMRDMGLDVMDSALDVAKLVTEYEIIANALEQAGMPRNMGPIAMMLMDHERSREIAKYMEAAAQEYFESGNATNLINHMKQYVEHITEHLWKENNRLFLMAEARLQYVSEKVDTELNEIENSKLQETGKTREHYEKLAENLSDDVSKQKN